MSVLRATLLDNREDIILPLPGRALLISRRRGTAKFGLFELLPRNLHSARKNRKIPHFTAKFYVFSAKSLFILVIKNNLQCSPSISVHVRLLARFKSRHMILTGHLIMWPGVITHTILTLIGFDLASSWSGLSGSHLASLCILIGYRVNPLLLKPRI